MTDSTDSQVQLELEAHAAAEVVHRAAAGDLEGCRQLLGQISSRLCESRAIKWFLEAARECMREGLTPDMQSVLSRVRDEHSDYQSYQRARHAIEEALQQFSAGHVCIGQSSRILLRRHQALKAQEYINDTVDRIESLHNHSDLAIMEEAIAGVRKAANDFCLPESETALVSNSQFIPTLMEWIEKNQNQRGILGLDTGFEHLNQLINGLLPGTLFLLGAMPGAGKTTFSVQMACELIRRNSVSVLMISLEQARWELEIRNLARFSRVDSRDILKGRLDRKNDLLPGKQKTARQALREGAQKYSPIAEHFFIFEGNADSTTSVMRQLVHRLQHREANRQVVLLVDYLQLIQLDEENSSTTDKERIDRVCSDLKRIARDMRVPVLAISSLNRAGYRSPGKKQGMDVLKESGGLEFTGDIVAILRETARSDQGVRQLSLDIVKNRLGERGEVHLRFHAPYAYFEELQ